jgi:hypothetical protein
MASPTWFSGRLLLAVTTQCIDFIGDPGRIATSLKSLN